MRKTILTCDRCGATSESKDFLSPLTVTRSQYGFSPYALANAEWCEKCLREVQEKLKLAAEPPKPDAPEQPRMTIEDLIREIVQEEVQQ